MRNNRKLIYIILVSLVVLAVILFAIVLHSKNGPLQVVFLDIGQGDSILISQGSQQLLIDGGKDGKLLLEKLGKYIPFWDRNIEAVIETHPDQDHIGGLINIFGAYKVNTVLETKMQSDSQTYKTLEEKISQLADEKIEARKNVEIRFSNGALAEILYPLESLTDISGKDTNIHSVVVKLTVGENKFLFVGDLPATEESKLLEKDVDVRADFLKIAHHGSKYATGAEFLGRVSPTDAIISVGKNNSYGHPNPEVLQRLTQYKANILRTDELGDIIYECINIDSKCERKSL